MEMERGGGEKNHALSLRYLLRGSISRRVPGIESRRKR